MPRVSAKLLLITVLVVAGFAAMLALVVGQLREVAVGGPLYTNLQRHAQLRQTLTLLRANLSEIRTLSTTARHTTDPDELRALATSTDVLQRQVYDQLRRVVVATHDPAVTMTLDAAEVAWDDFATTAAATFELMLRGDTRGLAAALERQAFRQGRFTDEVDSAINTLGLRDEDLEEESRARVTSQLWTIVLAGVGLAILVVALTLVTARSITRPLLPARGGVQAGVGRGVRDAGGGAAPGRDRGPRPGLQCDDGRAGPAGAGARGGAPSGRGSWPSQERVPRDDESRDPHPDERGDRHDGPAPRVRTSTRSSVSTGRRWRAPRMRC